MIKNLKNFYVYIYFLILSFIMLAFASQASYLYPVIEWTDPNCFYTIGKAIASGKVLYKDIFDHKGPYTYFYFCFAYILSKDSHISLYFLEVLLAFIFTIFTKKILELYEIKNLKTNIIICTVINLTIYFSYAVSNGNSVEELSLPFFAIILYISLKRLKSEQNLKFLDSFIVGLICGVLFWVKFTLLSFFVGWLIYFFIVYIKQKKLSKLFKILSGIISGFIIATIPCIIYFAVNNAFSDLVMVYFYDNIVVYPHINEKKFFYTIFLMLEGIFFALCKNFQISLPIIFGLIVFFKKKIKERCLILFTVISFFVFTYSFNIRYRYYAVPMGVFAVFGYISLSKIDLKKKFKSYNIQKVKVISLTLASIALCFSCCFAFFKNGNQYYIFKNKQDTAQFTFAEIINNSGIKNPKLLNYGFIDGGFYYVLKQVPSFKYFCTTNCKTDEIEKEIENYIKEKQADFIVVKIWKENNKELTSSNYSEISRYKQYDRGESITYILYQAVKN